MTVLTGTLIDRIAEIITRYSMLPPDSRVGVAVSGGADSVVLLHMLTSLRERFKIEPVVLHVNHHLRGAESDEDERFVRSLAATLDLECFVEHGPVEGGNIEQAARDARRAFFMRMMHDEKRVYPVALGHTASDQAETVLFRLLRGTGLAGLAGMQLQDPRGLVRPLLTTSRKEVREWAGQQGIEWREDRSNDDVRFARNRLRNQIMPLLTEQFNPNLESALTRTALLAQAEEEYWNEAISPICDGITKRTSLGLILNIATLNELHIAVQRRVIRHTLMTLRGDLRGLDADHIEAVGALCFSERGHDRVLIPGADVMRSFDRLLFMAPGTLAAQRRHYRVDLTIGCECVLPFRAGWISIAPENSGALICANFKKDQESGLETAFLDGRVLARNDALFVRNWEPGDKILRPGHSSAEKVKTLFQEHRILLWERRHWPVVVSGDRIAWIRGFGPAAEFAGANPNSELVRILYRAET